MNYWGDRGKLVVAIALGGIIVALCLVSLGSAGVVVWAGTIVQETAQVLELTREVESAATREAFSAETTATAAMEQTLEIEAENAVKLLEDVKEWEVVFQDNFDFNQNNWLEDEIEFERVSGDIRISGGKYIWEVTANEGFIYYAYPDGDAVEDFYLEVEIENISGPVYGIQGVVFRLANENFYYYYAISQGQLYEVSLRRGSGWVEIIPATNSEHINVGETNKIALISIEGTLYFFINDIFVDFSQNTEISRGHVGVLIGLYVEGDQGEFWYDDFEIRTPPTK